jgi:hypothetical protein
MLKKSGSGVFGSLSGSGTPVYTPRAKSPHSPFGKGGEGDLKALPVERRVFARRGRRVRKGLFEHPALLLAIRRFKADLSKGLASSIFQHPACGRRFLAA